MPKLPSIHLYPGDWYRDSISGCSLAAQGLWLRIMFLGHDSDRYGYLSQHGKPIPQGSIAQRCGCTPEQYLTLLRELDDAGVPSRTPEGIIYSRRMVRDGEKLEMSAERQRKHKKLKRVSNAGKTRKKRVSNVNENEIENEVEKGNGKFLKTKELNSETVWQDSPLFEFEKFREKLADWPEEKVHFYHDLFNLADPGKYKYSDWSLAARRWDKKDPWKGKQNQTKTLSQIFEGINAK